MRHHLHGFLVSRLAGPDGAWFGATIRMMAALGALAVGLGLGMPGGAAAHDDFRIARHDEARVSAGASHTCAVKANGDVACRGRNDDGQRPTARR